MAERTTLPSGFVLKTVETEANGVKYSVEVPQAESLEAILAVYREEQPDKNPEEILLAIWNAGNEQGAKQSPKTAIRKAIDEHGKDSEAVAKAVTEAQETSRVFIQGAPRGGGGGTKHESGLTKKQREALGAAVGLEMAKTGRPPSQKRMAEICAELDIDMASLEQDAS